MFAKQVLGKSPDHTVVPAAEEQISPFGHPMLPNETKMYIFSGLNATELSIASLVCREWRTLIADNFVWRVALGRDFKVFKAEKPKELYQHLCRIDRNLARGIYSTKVIQAGSGQSKVNCFHFEDQRLFVGCQERMIKIWNLDTLTCENTIAAEEAGHTLFFRLLNGEKIVAGEWTGEIKIRDLKTGALEKELKSDNGMQALTFASTSGGKLISGTMNGGLTVWNSETCQVEKELTGHTQTVSALILRDENTIISGDWAGEIRIWNIESGECTMTLKSDTQMIINSLILAENGKLIASDWGGKITIWDLSTGLRELTIRAYTWPVGVTSICLSNQGKLVSTCKDKTFNVWDLKIGACGQIFSTDADEITIAALMDQEKLILGSETGEVQILDLTASDSDVFEELAIGFEENRLDPAVLMERFSRMPEGARKKVYAELESIQGNSSSSDYPDMGQLAFHDRKGQTSSREQKAEAIRNYLNRESAQQTDQTAKEV